MTMYELTDSQTEKASEVVETSDAIKSSNMLRNATDNDCSSITQERLNASSEMKEPNSYDQLHDSHKPGLDRTNRVPQFRTLPDGFIYRDGFIWFSEQRDKDGSYNYDKAIRVCTPIEVIAKCSDIKGLSHGKVINVVSKQRGVIRTIIPAEVIGIDPHTCVKTLMKLGLEMPNAKTNKGLIVDLLNRWEPGRYATIVDQGGWDSQFRYFVIGEEPIKIPGFDEEIIYESLEYDHSFRTKGDFETWYEEVARPCEGNSRYMLAISMAFAGPLMKLTNTPSGGVHFYGESTGGKSTVAIAAGSVTGGGHPENGFLKQWATTPAGAEALFSQHNDLFMPMDEINQVSSDQLESIGYMFGNSTGKMRGNINIKAVAGKQWSVMMLSTGEDSVADKLAEKGIKEKTGLAVRITSIAADAGIILPDGSKGGTIEYLHGFSSPAEFADAIKKAAINNYGHAIRLYLPNLLEDTSVKEKVEGYQVAFMNQVEQLIVGNGQARRVAKKFSTIAAGGELAISYMLLPWAEGSAITAAVRCFQDWLKEWRGIGGNRELHVAAEEAFTYFRTKSRDHFDGMNLLSSDGFSEEPIPAKRERHGFIKVFKSLESTAKEVPCFVMHPDDFHKVVCKSSRSKALLNLLKARNLLLTDEESSRRKKVRIGDKKTAGMIVIKCSIKDESLSEE